MAGAARRRPPVTRAERLHAPIRAAAAAPSEPGKASLRRLRVRPRRCCRGPAAQCPRKRAPRSRGHPAGTHRLEPSAPGWDERGRRPTRRWESAATSRGARSTRGPRCMPSPRRENRRRSPAAGRRHPKAADEHGSRQRKVSRQPGPRQRLPGTHFDARHEPEVRAEVMTYLFQRAMVLLGAERRRASWRDRRQIELRPVSRLSVPHLRRSAQRPALSVPTRAAVVDLQALVLRLVIGTEHARIRPALDGPVQEDSLWKRMCSSPPVDWPAISLAAATAIST